eukprot:3656088-Pleurochrysis_carterae.AAC.1
MRAGLLSGHSPAPSRAHVHASLHSPACKPHETAHACKPHETARADASARLSNPASASARSRAFPRAFALAPSRALRILVNTERAMRAETSAWCAC